MSLHVFIFHVTGYLELTSVIVHFTPERTAAIKSNQSTFQSTNAAFLIPRNGLSVVLQEAQ